jgi:integrase
MASILKRTYKVKLPSGETITKECEHYTIQYQDANGKRRRVKGYKDKTATKQLAAKLERNHARGEQGLIDPFKLHRHRAISEQIRDYLANLESEGRDDKYIYVAELRLKRLAAECGWECLADIEPNAFIQWREAERKDTKSKSGRTGKGASATTLNQYLDTARAFTNWCATNDRMAGIPIAGGRKLANALSSVGKVDGEKRRKRRGLTDEQVVNILSTSPPERAIVYRVGIATGLRRAEIEALRWGDIRLNAIRPYIQLRAEATKARRADTIPLAQSLADELRSIKPADASDRAPVFKSVPTIAQWKTDLAKAKVPYKNDMDQQADFHGGCRQTLCTRLHRNGTPQLQAMKRMRVTDPRLLNQTYVDDNQLAAEATALPELLPSPKPETSSDKVSAG